MTEESSWAKTTVVELEQPELKYVGFWARLGAAVIDTVMLMILTSPLTYLIHGRLAIFGSETFDGPVDILINWLLPAVIVIWLWSALRATPGKLAINARIVDADTGYTPSMRQLLIRYLGYFASIIPFGLGLFWVGFDRRKQAWHDKLANTVVIHPDRTGPLRFEETTLNTVRQEPFG